MGEGVRDWQSVISDDLEKVSEYIFEATRDDSAEVQEILDYVISAQGKMVRPSLILLTYHACGREADEKILRYAAAAEMIHMATLVHDDIDDESDYRRGKFTVHKKYGVRKALCIGDVLLVRAMELFDFNPLLVDTFTHMGTGLADSEFIQFNNKLNLDIREDEYYRIISGKTAMFLSQCSKIGALVAEQPQETVDAMGNFGFLYGMAFQIADDLIDLLGTESESGKSSLRDLNEGIITLPTIIAMRDRTVGKRIRDMIRKDASSDEIRKLIEQTDAIDECKAVIKDYVDEALDSLAVLKDSEYKESLIELTRLNISRTS